MIQMFNNDRTGFGHLTHSNKSVVRYSGSMSRLTVSGNKENQAYYTQTNKVILFKTKHGYHGKYKLDYALNWEGHTLWH